MNNPQEEQFAHLDNLDHLLNRPTHFGKYDRWNSLWQTGGGETEEMLRCRKAPRFLHNRKTGKAFIGTYYCYSRPCPYCGSRERDRIGHIVYARLALTLHGGQALYCDTCRGSEWRRRQRQIGELKGDGYKIVRDNAKGRQRSPLEGQTIHSIATVDFSLGRWGEYAAFECERIDTLDALVEKLQLAFAMPPRILVRPLGKYPKTTRPRSEWKTITDSELLTREQLEAIAAEEYPEGIDELNPREFVAYIARVDQRIQEEIERQS